MKKIVLGIMWGKLLIVLAIVALVGMGFIQFRFVDAVTEPSTNDVKVIISKSVVEELNELYKNTDKEISACIELEQIYNYSDDLKSLEITYVIVRIEEVKIAGYDYSVQKYCDDGMIHSHPKNTPYFSLVDITAFKNRIKKGEIISVLMYGNDDFSYITRNNFVEQKLNIEEV